MVDGGLLWYVQNPAVTQEKDETRYIEGKINKGGPSPQSNHSF